MVLQHVVVDVRPPVFSAFAANECNAAANSRWPEFSVRTHVHFNSQCLSVCFGCEARAFGGFIDRVRVRGCAIFTLTPNASPKTTRRVADGGYRVDRGNQPKGEKLFVFGNNRRHSGAPVGI